jgi:thiol-disulfide isomerase/thioredoxin
MSSTKILTILAGVMLAAVLAVSLLIYWLISFASQPREPDQALVKESASVIANLKLEDLNGKSVELPGKGHYRIINYWASWCGPCIEEMPVLNQYADAANSDKNMPQIIGIALDEAEAVSEFLRENPSKYPNFIENYELSDSSSALGNTQETIPYTILIGPDGQLLKQSNGVFTDIEELKAFAKTPN